MQYPSSRCNSILKNWCDTWVAEGKNDIPAEELDAIFNGASDIISICMAVPLTHEIFAHSLLIS